MKKHHSKLGEFLRAARGEHTIEGLAELLGVNKNTVGGYERGERLPDLDFLARFATVTGADLLEMIEMRLRESSEAAANQAAAQVHELRGHLVQETPPTSYTAGVRLLENTLTAVESFLTEAGITLRPGAKSRVVVSVVELFQVSGRNPDKDSIKAIVEQIFKEDL